MAIHWQDAAAEKCLEGNLGGASQQQNSHYNRRVCMCIFKDELYLILKAVFSLFFHWGLELF